MIREIKVWDERANLLSINLGPVVRMLDLDPEHFELQVRDCLARFYDYAFLEQHPLVHVLAATTSGEARRVQAFRELIENAIESLKPRLGSDSTSKPARLYEILLARYINQEQVQAVSHRLNLGERQFYRDHNKAIHVLSQVLWGRATSAADAPAERDISIQSEIERIHSQIRPESISPHVFLEKALAAIHNLAERYQADIRIQVADQSLILTNDSAVLRQAIIWIVSQLIIHSAPNSRFRVAFAATGERGTFTFSCEQCHPDTSLLQLPAEQQKTLRNLVQALGAEINETDAAGEYYHLRLSISLGRHSLLIIDDNPDAISLFRRYFTGYPYQIFTANEAELALKLAADSLPDLIILDVILPEQDGWEILQRLKSQSLTANIPVLICSVLEAPELAHILGADGFLRKPPGEAEFLDALRHFSRITS